MALSLVSKALDAEYAKVLHEPVPGEPLVLTAGLGWESRVRVGEATFPNGRGSQAGYTLMSERPIILDDLSSEERFEGTPLHIDHGVISGLSVVIPDIDGAYGVLAVHTRRRHSFTADDADFLRLVANVLGGAVQNARSQQEPQQLATTRERRVSYHAALAQCAQALLASSGDERLQTAVEALLTATKATYAFVERNVNDPILGLCSRTTIEAEEPGYETAGDNHYWDLVPWDRMPISRSHLERGEPFVLIPDELVGVERELYDSDPFPVQSELNIPIFVADEWAGLVGFSDTVKAQVWTAEDLSLLTTAATMIGAFWEREAANQRLEELVRSKDEFLASVSHELRTPLTAVVGFGQILKEGPSSLSSHDRRELLESVVSQGMDLTNIVNDLLVAARVDIGTLQVTKVAVDLKAQTKQVLEAFDQDHETDIEVIGGSAGGMGDPDRVRQIIRNLISNALRYGGDDIKVTVLEDDSTASVIVADDGSGVPDKDRERIFELYQRAHDRPGLAESLGLGLTISRHLARLMGGDVTYRYEDGSSAFELTLPKGS